MPKQDLRKLAREQAIVWSKMMDKEIDRLALEILGGTKEEFKDWKKTHYHYACQCDKCNANRED